MDMLGLIFSGSLCAIFIIGKQFTVWMLFSVCLQQNVQYKAYDIFLVHTHAVLQSPPFLSDRWCFFLCWEGGTFYISVCSPLFISSELHPSATHNTTCWISNGYPSFVKQYRWILRNNYILPFLRVLTGSWHAEHYSQTTWLRRKRNTEVSEWI